MKAPSFLLLLLAAGPAAAGTNFRQAGSDCQPFAIAGLSGILADAQKWEGQLPNRFAAIEHFTQKTCPDYLKRPNDGDALAAFQAEKAKLETETYRFSQEGGRIQTFLEQNHDGINDFFKGTGMYFTDFSCGVLFWNERNFFYTSLRRLAEKMKKVGLECPAVRAALDAPVEIMRKSAASQKVPPHRWKGKPGPRPAQSDVTGVERDLRNEQQRQH